MRQFKFFDDNGINIQDDPLYHLNVFENMVLGLISYCYRMNLSPLGYQHQFYESGPNVAPGNSVNRHLVINDLISHDYFESRHVRIRYEIYDRNGTNQYTFHLAEDVYNEVIRRYENI
jgi:hypothetical protein